MIDLHQSPSLTLPSDEEKRDRHTSAQHQPTTSERAVAAAPTRRLSSSSCFIQSVIIHFSSFPLPPSANERTHTHTHTHTHTALAHLSSVFRRQRAASNSYSRSTHTHHTRAKLEWPLQQILIHLLKSFVFKMMKKNYYFDYVKFMVSLFLLFK